jgi:hypothetical protein
MLQVAIIAGAGSKTGAGKIMRRILWKRYSMVRVLKHSLDLGIVLAVIGGLHWQSPAWAQARGWLRWR